MENVTEPQQQLVPPSLSQESIVPPPQKKKFFFYFMCGLLLISSIVLISSYIYLLWYKPQQTKPAGIQTIPLQTTPTSIPIDTWKTYKNLALGFTMDYPPSWTVIEENGLPTFYPPGVTKGMWDKAADPMPGGDPSIQIALSKTPFAQSDAKNEARKPLLDTFELITIDDAAGYYYHFQACAPMCPIIVDFPYHDGTKTLKLLLWSMGKEGIDTFNKKNNTQMQDADEKTFKKMIASMKFPPTQLYTNALYGFSIKYPTTWYAYTGNGWKNKSIDDYTYVNLSFESPPQGPGGGMVSGLRISVYPNTTQTPLEYATSITNDQTSIKTTALQGKNTIRVEKTTGAGNPGPAVIVIHKNALISFTAEGLDTQRFEELLQTVIFQ